VASYRRAVAIKPDFVAAYYNLGNALKDLGLLDEAAASYRKAVELRPDFADAHYNLGNALKALGQLDAAAASYRRVVELKPDYADAHYNLGNTLKELGQLDEAAACFRRVLKIDPDSVIAHNNLGAVLQDLGQLDDASANYQRALEIDPGCDDAMVGIGHLCVISGKMKEAEAMIDKALGVNPDNLEARLLLASIRKAKAGDGNLSALLAADEAAQNSRSPIPGNQKISLQFALGKSFDDLGDHDRAFPHFIEGCKMKRATFEYDAAQMTRYFNDVMRVFDRTTIERLRGGGNPSKVPIFVLGMPRSGTTLTEQIIASHPDVHGAGELPDMWQITKSDIGGTRGFPGNILALDHAGLTGWADRYVAGLRQHAPDAPHITDKMPSNFLYIGLIHVMLPNAKIIHVNRNPVDTCLSCLMTLFNKGIKYSYDLAELGGYYIDYARLMDHWRDVLPAGAFLDVQYEDIVADQEAQARRMTGFCGLEWNDACIDFHKHERSVRTASWAQVRQPIYKSSVERWRPYEKYLGPLLDALGDLAPKRN
jgi:tetratricopeptide (TPR) repeat protein